MRNIWLLLKNYFICGIGNFRRKTTRTKTVVGISIVTITCLAWFAFFTWCTIGMGQALAEFNLQANVLAIGLMISLFISVIFALQKVTGGQKASDTELLLSMPFKKIEIMFAKALWRFLVNMIVIFMFFVPSVIAYLVCSPFSFAGLSGCLVVMLLIPLMSVGLSYVVDYLATVCFSNSKFGNIGKAVFTLIILIGAITIYEFVMFNSRSPFMVKLIQWMINFNPLVMIPLISGISLLFVLGNWLNALLLNRETRSAHIKVRQISTKTISPFRAILKNETNRYFNSPTLMLNTILGPLALLALTIWMLVDHGKTLTNYACSIFGVTPEAGFLLVSIFIGGLTILTYPAAFSISLEGKQLWILRSMPIPAHTILNAKVLFNVILVSPISIVCGAILSSVLQLSALNFIAIMLIPVLTNVLVSYAGVFINLCFPKLEFESEASVIKNSLSSFVMMFGGMVIIALMVIFTIFLIGVIPLVAITSIIIATLAVAVIIVTILTYTLGQRMFNRL